MSFRLGFTLVEVMITIAVISILTGVIVVSLNQGTAQARDAERKADLRTMQSAIELYRQKYDRYPAGCNDGAAGVESSWLGNWSGQSGGGYDCASGNQYIVGLAPEFIPVLPVDPKLNDNVTNSGYVYTTNPEGTVYKLMALNTVEDDFIENNTETGLHQFARCGDMTTTEAECAAVPGSASGGGMGFVYNSDGNTPNECNNPATYRDDYAVWGGYAPGGGSFYRDLPKAREYYSDKIRCK